MSKLRDRVEELKNERYENQPTYYKFQIYDNKNGCLLGSYAYIASEFPIEEIMLQVSWTSANKKSIVERINTTQEIIKLEK